jgi:sugar O-acyltransferase (sialic acid O-acetyltransferase NeuD family)
MNKPMINLVFLGGSDGVGEILQIINAINDLEPTYKVIGALDDHIVAGTKSHHKIPILGPLSLAQEQDEKTMFVFAIGSKNNYQKRLDILADIGVAENRYETLIHPVSNIYPTAKIGIGAIVHFGATISQGVEIGAFSLITINVAIGSFSVIGKASIICSQVFIGGYTNLGPCSFIGASSSIAENVSIGAGAMVGMASAVMREIPDGAFALGNPSKNLTSFPLGDLLKAEAKSQKNR